MYKYVWNVPCIILYSDMIKKHFTNKKLMTKMIPKTWCSVLFALFALSFSSPLFAQQNESSTASQVMSVTVATVVKLKGPVKRTVTLDRSSSGSTTKTQEWNVVSNSTSGADLTLSTRSFSRRGNRRDTRPARLKLRKNSGRNWAVKKGSDVTPENGGRASVRASADGPGNASFKLSVSFVENRSADKRSDGVYTTTIHGTVTQK